MKFEHMFIVKEGSESIAVMLVSKAIPNAHMPNSRPAGHIFTAHNSDILIKMVRE